MRQFTLASILALTILGGVAVSSADAQYWRRGTYYYPRTTYYSRPYSNVYSNVLQGYSPIEVG